MLKWYGHNWYKIGAVALIALTFLTGLWWYSLVDTLTLILIYNLLAVLAHQTEEYLFPGGAQVVLNAGFYGEKKDYDRYPGNALSSGVVNTLAWGFYVAAIIFSQAIWLGLALMLFGFFQVIGHGGQMNIKTKGWYNPGLATAICIHLPVGIYYIAYVTQHGLATGTDLLWGAVTFVVVIAVTVALPVQGLKSRDSDYPFTPEELNKFGMLDKLKARGVI